MRQPRMMHYSGIHLNFVKTNRFYILSLIRREISYIFAQFHANMTSTTRKKCDMVEADFKDGITNGAKWYPVCGSMQDYNYLSSNCFEITIELGCDKFPAGKTLAQYWKDNIDSFYEFMWLVRIWFKI